MNFSFGPWTTAIDSGSRAQLSAFWRKRIGMLSSLVAAPPRVSRGGWLLLLVAGTLSLGWPTLYFSRSVAAAAGPSEQQERAVEATEKADQRKPRPTVPGGPILVPLPGGVTAELIGLADHTVKEKSWWAPDGTPIAAPYQKFHARANPGPGQVAREIAVRFRVPQDADVTAKWKVTPSFGYSGGRPEDAQGKPIPEIKSAGVILPAAQLTCDITLSVAAGEWKTLTETDGRSYFTRGTQKYGFAYTKALENDGGVVITITYNMVGQDMRIVVVDLTGKIIPSSGLARGGSRGFDQTTGIFHRLRLQDVSKFLLQARPYHRVEIRDVALRMEQHTRPKIVDLGEDMDED